MKTKAAGKTKTKKATVKSCDYITIGQAAKFCDFSPDFLDKDAKQKKLKTVKKGNDLLTTRGWLDKYLAQSKKWDDLTAVPKNKISDELADEIARELI
jgi:hypothetical protein